jgi:hypothetical protein
MNGRAGAAADHQHADHRALAPSGTAIKAPSIPAAAASRRRESAAMSSTRNVARSAT